MYSVDVPNIRMILPKKGIKAVESTFMCQILMTVSNLDGRDDIFKKTVEVQHNSQPVHSCYCVCCVSTCDLHFDIWTLLQRVSCFQNGEATRKKAA